ncbi:hypothetical protein KVR01_002348 [Diaporthe batatas]|uniref:uncharacterized protein n=1 Tax=Diaporthe batatas TaxID=748121 RepID=UPI001D047544|nr:uncharacterized protein KVR01_002348 [Diaporthe batatas]KAG8166659.1 hypothetical protein KVR01_002348 [Diaporthe batatas]
MPIFRENLDHHDVSAPQSESPVAQPVPLHLSLRNHASHHMSLTRQLSEESIRTELCEGPVPDPSEPSSPTPGLSVNTTSDRIDLIERLKKGESPTWSPKRHFDALFRRSSSREQPSSPQPTSSESTTLSPPSKDRLGAQTQETEDLEHMQQGLAIERPRSALHSGDFTPHASATRQDELEKQGAKGFQNSEGHYREHHSRFATSPPRDFTPFKFDRRIPYVDPPDGFRASPPSVSSSISSSFVYKHPTSPLVQSESNDDLSLSMPISHIDLDPPTPSRLSRRQTLSGLYSHQNVPTTAQRIPGMYRESIQSYQAHQPRRSLTSTPTFSLGATSPQSSAFSRRPSLGLESSSPLHQTSMVGSYEESILRGRMSTTPSKPLDFMAQIGVLGLGNCKSSLRCPAHVTLPFPAVFYSYVNTPHGRSKSDDGPSPYVGQIDLENGLANPDETSRQRRKSHQRSMSAANRQRMDGDEDIAMTDINSGVDVAGVDARKANKLKRRSNSPKAPPGGSYRIPEKGQIQIIIKNQNKTAVKLFLVPYDLEGMEPGTKTFIRQRCYSAGGPIVENLPSTSERPTLRYLVHLHICCPAKGRFYLYKSIRVVFANRVPDGKEKLRNEVTLPEPKFTPYKPVRVMHQPVTQATTGPGASLAAEKAFRRRSSGFSFGGQQYQQLLPPFDAGEPMPMPSLSLLRARASSFQDRGLALGRPVGAGLSGCAQVLLAPTSVPAAEAAPAPTPPLSFAKGDVAGYVNGGGAHLAGGGSPGAAIAEGLLSQRLRSLGMQSACSGELELGDADLELRGD